MKRRVIIKMNITPAIVVAVLLAFFGFVASVSGVILHLRVANVFKEVQLDIQKIYTHVEQVRSENHVQHSQVQLAVEQLKTKVAETTAENYRQIMAETRKQFIDRDVADSKHLQNVQRLDMLSDGLRVLVGDLKDHRSSVEQRLQSIEERLPV